MQERNGLPRLIALKIACTSQALTVVIVGPNIHSLPYQVHLTTLATLSKRETDCCSVSTSREERTEECRSRSQMEPTRTGVPQTATATSLTTMVFSNPGTSEMWI